MKRPVTLALALGLVLAALPAAAQEAFLDALEWFLRTVQEDDRTA